MGKKEYLENIESMNAFYSLVLEVEKRFRKEFPGMEFMYQFEALFTAGDYKIKPDVMMRYQVGGKILRNVLAVEYKDASRAENVLKKEQIAKYTAVDEKAMRESGLQILRNAIFEGTSVVYKERSKDLTHDVKTRYKEINDVIDFPLGVFALAGRNVLKTRKIVGDSLVLLELACKEAFLFKELCLFDFKTDMKRRVKEVKQLPENIRSNMSVFLAMLLGYSIRLSWKDHVFTVVDVIRSSSPTTWRIMEKIKNVQRILRVFDEVVKNLLVKNKYLILVGETEICVDNKTTAGVNSYKFNQDKNLSNKKTRDSLRRLVRKYLDEEIFGEKFIDELPLFKWNRLRETINKDNSK